MPVETIADLPLELIEKIVRHVDVTDVAKLMMVNKGLYSSYAMDQSILFGKHVAVITLGTYDSPELRIQKFVDSPSIQLNETLLSSVKRIDSCDKLECFNAENGMLDKLKFVNQLKFELKNKEDCLKFLTDFRGLVKKNATLDFSVFSFEQDDETTVQLGKFIENQLAGCEKITLDCTMKDCPRVYLEAMMQTQIKMISIPIWQWNFDGIVDWIVKRGIPSKNSEAVIHIVTPKRFAGVSDFLSPVQGFERVDDDENHLVLLSRANELLRGLEGLVFSFDKNSSCFRRRIDSTKSCIYVFHQFGLQFLAFYMPSQ